MLFAILQFQWILNVREYRCRRSGGYNFIMGIMKLQLIF